MVPDPRRPPHSIFFRALDALAVDDGRGRAGLPVGLLAAADVKRVVQPVERAVVAPSGRNSGSPCCAAEGLSGCARHWQPVLRTYISPLTTSRTSTVRLLPPRLARGISGSTRPIPRQSGRSDSAACCGHIGCGSRSSTSASSCESGAQTWKSQAIPETQDDFGPTLRPSNWLRLPAVSGSEESLTLPPAMTPV